MSELHTMKLGDRLKEWGGVWDVWRVPGGWIFSSSWGETGITQFVPFSAEFSELPPNQIAR